MSLEFQSSDSYWNFNVHTGGSLLVEHDDVEPNRPEESSPQVSLTIITGFLGAGKTSLLRFVLRINRILVSLLLATDDTPDGY